MLLNSSIGLLANAGSFEPHPAFVLFFAVLLLAIAIFPLAAEHWWESNRNKAIVAGILSLPVLVLYLMNQPSELHKTALEYLSFLILIWSLYTISGGIVLQGTLRCTPATNTFILGLGAGIANLFGTTGAAMLLIRPLLKANEHRQNKKHIVIFFIFLVANVGGCLTPLGDPPLFLGFLRGVPFTWTLALLPVWAFAVAALLLVFYIWDRKAYAGESAALRDAAKQPGEKLKLAGWFNFFLIGGVLTATLTSSMLGQIGAHWAEEGSVWGEFFTGGGPWRELIMVTMGLLSMALTPKALREENRFNFGAIIEVGVLFAGIFVTMIPALALLHAHGRELGLTEPWQFFWAAGGLSSFLDNAPTYLVFATTGLSVSGAPDLHTMATAGGLGYQLLLAVSAGAVFMGANTYIGNAPNFMVKAIADSAQERRVKMPSFFGYMAYSCLILIPLFIVITFIFFRLLIGQL